MDYGQPFEPVIPAAPDSHGSHRSRAVSAIEIAPPHFGCFYKNTTNQNEITAERYSELQRWNESAAREQSTNKTLRPRLLTDWRAQQTYAMTPILNDMTKPLVDVQTVLRNSNWYKRLGSENRHIADEQLAILSDALNRFNSNPATDKCIDLTFLGHNRALQQMLSNLGVRLSDTGVLEELSQMEHDQSYDPQFQRYDRFVKVQLQANSAPVVVTPTPFVASRTFSGRRRCSGKSGRLCDVCGRWTSKRK